MRLAESRKGFSNANHSTSQSETAAHQAGRPASQLQAAQSKLAGRGGANIHGKSETKETVRGASPAKFQPPNGAASGAVLQRDEADPSPA